MAAQHKAYKFRLYPNPVQAELIKKTFGCVRLVYNTMLDKRKTTYAETGKSLSRFDCNKLLPAMKHTHPFLKEVDSTALQQANANLQDAFDRFFKKQGGYPTFHKKRHGGSYTTVSTSIKVNDDHVFLPKLGWVKFAKSREVVGTIKQTTVSRKPSGRYYISISCETDIQPLEPISNAVGVDMGIHNLVAISDGTTIAGPKYLHQSMAALARAQRKLSRMVMGSANWEKQRIKVARINEHIANQRTDTLHKLSTSIIRKNQTVCIEDLDVRSMLQERHRAKWVCDVGFGEFRRMLEYKAQWYGRQIVAVPQDYPSSQLCSRCGYQYKQLGSKQSWTCPNCGTHHNRDINAAHNILTKGHAMLNLRTA